MSNPILPPGVYAIGTEEKRFDLATIDRIVAKIAAMPSQECGICGVIVKHPEDDPGERCPLCGYSYGFNVGIDLNIKSTLAMTRGKVFSFNCGCAQCRIPDDNDPVLWTSACDEHRGEILRMKTGAL